MFKIGDFSRLSRVSVRALRLYDQMGLLRPMHVDPDTGYRYYSAEQLSCLNQIVAFKDLGFSLEQIAELLNDHIPPAQIRGMLRLKQAEVQQAIEAEQARLTRIEARLQQIEQGDFSSAYTVVVKQVEAQPVAAIRNQLPLCTQVQQLHTELADYLRSEQAEIAGYAQTLWHDAEFKLEQVDAEAIAPISQLLSARGNIRTYTLPQVEQMACVIHQGSFHTVVQAFNALLQWIDANHYQIAGANREIYIHPKAVNAHFTNDCDSAVLEIQFPICDA